jgi:hypothetical protein
VAGLSLTPNDTSPPAQRIRRSATKDRHCERSEAIHFSDPTVLDCFVAPRIAMTNKNNNPQRKAHDFVNSQPEI